jgi:tetratricopeptide (TPR) repeat protein
LSQTGVRLKDYREHEISGATSGARDAFERALEAHLSWRDGAKVHLAQALLEAPSFTMAHVLEAYLSLCSRDVARVHEARAAHARAATLPMTHREQLHVAVVGAALADDFETANELLRKLLQHYPRDVLALQTGHALDYLTGDIEALGARVTAVLPAWSEEVPGYHAVLAMQAFGLVESARYELAEDRGQRALELDPFDTRAHHAVTHVYEMTGNALAGSRWMRERLRFWAIDTIAATHCWWHWALFHLAQGNIEAALELYDQRVRLSRSRDIADMIDASALLWRIELLGANTGRRWPELASAWAQHIDDGYCTFNDLHAMLALVGARHWKNGTRLEHALLRRRFLPTRYGETTVLVGLPACRAIAAFGRGDYSRAVELLDTLPPFARRLGGSHAQRDLMDLTRAAAVRRARRPERSAAA